MTPDDDWPIHTACREHLAGHWCPQARALGSDWCFEHLAIRQNHSTETRQPAPWEVR